MAEGEISINVKSTGAQTVSKQLSALELQLVSLAGTLDSLFKGAGGEDASQKAFVDALNEIKASAKETASLIKDLGESAKAFEEAGKAVEAGAKATQEATQATESATTAKKEEARAQEEKNAVIDAGTQIVLLNTQATEEKTEAESNERQTIDETNAQRERKVKIIDAEVVSVEEATRATERGTQAQREMSVSSTQTARGISGMVGALGIFAPELSRTVAIVRTLTRAFTGASKSITSMGTALKIGIAGGVLVSIATIVKQIREEFDRMSEKAVSLVNTLGTIQGGQRAFEADAPVRRYQFGKQLEGMSSTEIEKLIEDETKLQKVEEKRVEIQREQAKALRAQIRALEGANGEGPLNDKLGNAIARAVSGEGSITDVWGGDTQKLLELARGIPALANEVAKFERAQKVYEENDGVDGVIAGASLAGAMKSLFDAMRAYTDGVKKEEKRLTETLLNNTRAEEHAERIDMANEYSALAKEREAREKYARDLEEAASLYNELSMKRNAPDFKDMGVDDLAWEVDNAQKSIDGMLGVLRDFAELSQDVQDSYGGIEGLRSALEEEQARMEGAQAELEARQNQEQNDAYPRQIDTDSLRRVGGYVGGVSGISSYERLQQETARNTKDTATATKEFTRIYKRQVNTGANSATATFA